jgi:Zn-dependent peptidase ImmA (M78 family)
MEAAVTNVPLWKQWRSMVRGLGPREAADLVLRSTGVHIPPVDPIALIYRLGGLAFTQQMQEEGCINTLNDPPHIVVNAHKPIVRQRFTFAHELGHMLLHPVGKMHRDKSYASPGDREEREADSFAAHLLMPLWMLEPLVTAGYTIEQLCRLFNVSAGALRWQLETLQRGG